LEGKAEEPGGGGGAGAAGEVEAAVVGARVQHRAKGAEVVWSVDTAVGWVVEGFSRIDFFLTISLRSRI